jgi:hypothetical protein
MFYLDIPFYTYVHITSNQTLTPFGNSVEGQVGFGLIYLVISIVAVFGLTAALARNKIKDKIFWVIAAFFLISASLMSISNIYFINPIYTIIGVVAIWILYVLGATGRIKSISTIPFITVFVVMAAIALVITLPLYTLLILPIAFSVWDFYAVFRGPMTKLATGMMKMPKTQHLFMMKLGASTIGLGDLLFYCMTTGFALTFGLDAGVTTIGFMIFGIWMTFLLLSSGRYRTLPGLPIPILCGLLGLALSIFL